MTPATTVLVIIAAAIAFWAGHRWQHNWRTWTDHRQAAKLTKDLAARRWKTLWAALIAAVLLLAGCLAGSGLLAARVKPPPRRPLPTCTPTDRHPLRSPPGCSSARP